LEHVVDGRSWTGEATTETVRAGSDEKLPTYQKGDTVDCWYDPESLGGDLWLWKVGWRARLNVHATNFPIFWLCAIVLAVKRRAVESKIGKVLHDYLMTALG